MTSLSRVVPCSLVTAVLGRIFVASLAGIWTSEHEPGCPCGRKRNLNLVKFIGTISAN